MTIPNKDCLKTEAELPILWFFLLLHLAQKISDTTENKIHTRYRYAISKSFITGTVRGTRDICPVIRKTLQPFTLQRRQSPDQFPVLNNTFIFADILIINPLMICISNGSYRILIRLTHQIRSILMLSGTLSRCYPILQKFITSLAAEHCMTVCARKSLGYIRLASQTISSILYFPINDISGNTITLRHI